MRVVTVSEPRRDRHECRASNSTADVWGSILSLTRSLLECNAIEGESPVGEEERSEPNEYRPLDRGREDGSTKSQV